MSKITKGGQPLWVDDEIGLLDLFGFLTASWKILVIAAITGFTFGFCAWFLLGTYKAQLYVENNESISITSLKSLQRALPNLAARIIRADAVPKGKEEIYHLMSDPDWWRSSITPIFSLTKLDIKEMGADVKEGSNSIILLAVNGVARSKQSAIKNSVDTIEFIQQGWGYLAIEALLRGQHSELINAEAEIEGKINSTMVELEYQQLRLKNLQALSKNFQGEIRASQQVVDPKESAAKYLPLSTQSIAISTDINNSIEALSRLRDRQLGLQILKKWLAAADPILASSFNGNQINRDLLALEERQRADLAGSGPKELAFLDSVRISLINNESRFKWGLHEVTTVSVKKTGFLKFALVGLIGALCLTFSALFIKAGWLRMKRGGSAS